MVNLIKKFFAFIAKLIAEDRYITLVVLAIVSFLLIEYSFDIFMAFFEPYLLPILEHIFSDINSNSTEIQTLREELELLKQNNQLKLDAAEPGPMITIDRG